MQSTILLFIVALCGYAGAAQLDEVFSWKEVEFDWPNEQVRQNALANKTYIPYNNLPLGLERWSNKLFITIPRWKSGIASSLNYVDLASPTKSPILHPYPSLEANTLPTAHGKVRDDQIISTFRVRADECDRLWVMDSDIADILGEYKTFSRPALVIFDLKTDQLIRRYTFPEADVKPHSFFASVAVDVQRNRCDEAFAYVADIKGFGISVYDFKNDKSWRIEHNYFHFDPLAGDYTIGGVNFQWPDGIFGLALTPISNNGYRDLIFHAISSNKEFVVSTEVLRNQTRAQDPKSYHDFKLLGYRGYQTQATSNFVDETTGILFYTQINHDAVACWNLRKPFIPSNLPFIAQSNETLVYPNDLKVDRDGNLWVLSDHLPEFLYSHLDTSKVNYRILRGTVSEIVANTPCA